jgi:hypothetical protein
MKRITQATRVKNQALIDSADIESIMKVIEKAGITLETMKFDNSIQDSYTHETINGPNTYRGRPYSPKSFEYMRDQVEQAENIFKKHGLI